MCSVVNPTPPPTVLVLDHPFPDLTVLRSEVAKAGGTLLDASGGPAVSRADAIETATAVVTAAVPLDRRTIERMRACRAIVRTGIGVEAIALAAAAARGILVINVPDYCGDEVADHALALLLALARRLDPLVRQVRDGGWDYRPIRPVPALAGSRLGLVGFGRIGRRVAQRARAFRMHVEAFDPYVAGPVFAKEGVSRAGSLATLLTHADFVSLHAPLTDETRGLLDARALGHMQPTACLINTARGGLVVEEALVAALRAGRIAGAALDVLAQEPPPADHPLRRDPRVLLTPHAAWYSERSLAALQREVAEEVARVLRGDAPRHAVRAPA